MKVLSGARRAALALAVDNPTVISNHIDNEYTVTKSIPAELGLVK